MNSIFEFDDYREFFAEKRNENSRLRGFQTIMAEAAGCQRAYLSQVMNGHVQFTPDHAMGLAELFGLNRDEREYLLDLLSLERARTKRLKEWFKQRIKDQQLAWQNLSKKLQATEEITNQFETEYYSKWYYSAIHMLVGIPKFQTVASVAARLNLSAETVTKALAGLESMGLIENNGKQWLRSKKNLHIAQSKMMNTINHINWRQKSIADIQQECSTSLHYTAVHSLSAKDVEAIKAIFVEAIANSRSVVAPSLDEDLVCVCCDVFIVS